MLRDINSLITSIIFTKIVLGNCTEPTTYKNRASSAFPSTPLYGSPCDSASSQISLMMHALPFRPNLDVEQYMN